MNATRLWKTAPYVVVLVITGALFVLAGRFDFTAPGGRIGPDFWPKVILGMATLTCIYQIVKILFFDPDEIPGVFGQIVETAPGDAAPEAPVEERHTGLIMGGIALTIAYVVLIEYVGFFLCTFVYLSAFAWIGRYRRWSVVLLSGLIGSLAFMYMFMKVVYVSLPLGQGPFAQVTFFLMRVMGIR